MNSTNLDEQSIQQNSPQYLPILQDQIDTIYEKQWFSDEQGIHPFPLFLLLDVNTQLNTANGELCEQMISNESRYSNETAPDS